MNSLKSSILVISFFLSAQLLQAQLLIPMDMSSQRDHLKAYGLMYSAIEQGYDCHWLLNYRGGAFSITDGDQNLIREAIRRGVSYESLSEGSLFSIMESLPRPAENINTIALPTVPRIEVYSTPRAQPWVHAVPKVWDYTATPFTTIY